MSDSLLHTAIERHFAQAVEATAQSGTEQVETLEMAVHLLADTVARGGKILIGGAGETAFLAPYLASRLGGQLERERPPLPALALQSDLGWPVTYPSGTAQALPYAMQEQWQQSLVHTLVQQIQQLAHPDDVLWLISADAQQSYTQQVVTAAQSREVPVVWMYAGRPSDLASEHDVEIVLPEQRSVRALEQMLLAAHAVCDALDGYLLGLESLETAE